MPTVHTIEGARGRKRRRNGRSGASQRARFKAAAKACKGRPLKAFRACMRQKLS